MAGICWFAGAWFAYDGFIGYPQKIPAAEAFDELREIEDSDERILKWKESAEANGWSKDVPKATAEEIREDIFGQYIWMTISLLGGIPALIYYFACRGTWVESTPEGLKTSWGKSVDFSKVSELNKRSWSNKGIAKATYEVGGKRQVFVFDDFKYDREPLGNMLRRLEDQLDREKIVGGLTESETEAARVAEEEGVDSDEDTAITSSDEDASAEDQQ